MDKLPCEIISGIFSHIGDRHDIANFRCVQLTFARIGLPFLFGEISIQPTPFGLNALLEISHRSTLATYVKTVVIHVKNVIETVLDSYRRAEGGPIRPGAPEIRDNVEIQLDRLNLCARALYDSQKSSDTGGLLIAALAHLPNLKALNFVDGPERLNPIRNIQRTRVARQQLQNLLFALPGFTGSAPDRSFWIYFNKKQLYSFKSKVLIQPGSFGIQRGAYSPHIVTRMSHAFKGCKEIELGFYTERQGREDIPDDLKKNLFKVLSPARELERLSLSFGIDMRLVNFRAPFDVIFEGGYIWLHLREFTIAGFGIKGHDLLEFLKCHRMTLRKVSIMNCELYTSYWCVVVKAMKETLQLTSFEMGCILLDRRGSYSAGEIQEMKDYVLCVGEWMRSEWVRLFSRRAEVIGTRIWRGSPSVQG